MRRTKMWVAAAFVVAASSAAFVQEIVEVHASRGSAKTFTECFGKVDPAKMQAEWKAFVDGISIEK